jgi:hypothetical protein
MSIDKATVQQIIECATEDPDFVAGLARDPQGTLEAAGITVSAEDAQAVERALQASEASLAEPLQARISPAGLASLFGALAHEVGTFSGNHAPDIVRDAPHPGPDIVRDAPHPGLDIVRDHTHPAPDIPRV